MKCSNLHMALLGVSLAFSCGRPEPQPTPEKCSSANCSGGCCQYGNFDEPGTCVKNPSATTCGLSGQSCFACTDEKSCVQGACAYVEEPFPTGSKFVFMTLAAYSGNLGGLSGADAKCQAAAVSAGRSGTFKAWLSNYDEDGLTGNVRVNVSAYERITGTGPWFLTCRTDKKKIIRAFANRSGLQGAPLDFINCDENGNVRSVGGETYVWTGTETGGAPLMKTNLFANCSGWTSSSSSWTGLAGENRQLVSQWTKFLEHECDATGRLYCFEQ